MIFEKISGDKKYYFIFYNALLHIYTKEKNVKVTKVIITLICIEKQRETMNKAKVEKRKKKANLYRGNYQRQNNLIFQIADNSYNCKSFVNFMLFKDSNVSLILLRYKNCMFGWCKLPSCTKVFLIILE